MKKFISLFMAILIVFFSVMPSFALSVTEPDDMTSSAVAAMYPEVFKAIKEGVENLETSIDVSEFQLLENEIITIYKSFVFENPQLFYINPYLLSYSLVVSTDFLFALRPTYLFEIDEIPGKIKKFDKAVEFYLQEVDSSWSNFRKCRYIHDLMASTIKYDSQYNDDKPLIYSAYGALVDNFAVCQGYTLAYNYLMKKLNIKAYFVENTDYDHSWSMVKLGDNYYHVDIVWDDPADDLLGRALHNLCLVSDSKMKKERPSLTWFADHKAKSTTFDNAWWKSVETIIYTIEGKDYYIDHVYGADRYGALKCYNPSTEKHSVLLTIKDRWFADDSKTQYWSSNFSGLSYNEGRLFFNTPDAVYSIKTDGTGKKKFYTKPLNIKNDLYGMSLMKDGEFYVQHQKIPDMPGKTMKISFPLGDVTLDGVRNILDVTTLQKYLVKKITLTEKQRSKGDFNQDGQININDVTDLQRKITGL